MARKNVLDAHPLIGSEVALLTKDPDLTASALVPMVW
jgi:hypothetical protein